MYPKIGHSYSVINVYKAVNTQLSLRSILGAILDSEIFSALSFLFSRRMVLSGLLQS